MAKSTVKHYRKRAAGLTLIEVLIALAIVAIALTAVIKTVSQNIRSTAYLQDKTIAMWVGELTLNEAKLNLLSPSMMDNTTHITNMLERDWYWRAVQEDTPNKQIRKITVRVFAQDSGEVEEAGALIELQTFIARAAE